MTFADQLNQAIKKKNSPICVGLDPRLSQIPDFIKNRHTKEHGKTTRAAAESIIEFNHGIIDAVADLVPLVKPQSAFYEQYGYEGTRALEETSHYAQSKGLLVLLDGKRNDIGSTAAGYSNAYLGKVDLFGQEQEGLNADALTVNAYLGSDGIRPLLEDCKQYNKGIFILVKTSNPSSGELQDLQIAPKQNPVGAGLAPAHVGTGVNPAPTETVFEKVAHLVSDWGQDLVGDSNYSSVGIVVGATYPEQIKNLRKILPQSIFLIPGYGAQGGGAADVLPAFNEDGLGAIINNSRGINFAYEKNEQYSPENYADAARAATKAMHHDLSQALGTKQ